MPLREFICREGHTTEKFLQRAADDKRKSIICPVCAKLKRKRMAARKQISLPSSRRAFDLDY